MIFSTTTNYTADFLDGNTVEAKYSPAKTAAISPKYPEMYATAIEGNQLVIAEPKSASQSESRKNCLKGLDFIETNQR